MKRFFAGLLLTAMADIDDDTGGCIQLVFLRRAPERNELRQAETERIDGAHGEYPQHGRSRGAGGGRPFGDTPPAISGVFVFRTASPEEARRMAAADPTVVEHRNTVDVLAWRGPRSVSSISTFLFPCRTWNRAYAVDMRFQANGIDALVRPFAVRQLVQPLDGALLVEIDDGRAARLLPWRDVRARCQWRSPLSRRAARRCGSPSVRRDRSPRSRRCRWAGCRTAPRPASRSERYR